MTDHQLDTLLNTWAAPEPTPDFRRRVRAAIRTRSRTTWRNFLTPRWAAAAVAACLTLAVGAAIVQHEPVIARFSGGVAPGIYLRSALRVEPPLAWLKWGGLGTGAGGGIRYWWDRSARTWSGYRLQVEPAGTGLYRVTVLPLESDAIRRSAVFPVARYTAVALPALPPARLVGEGEPFDIDVFRKPGTSERIYDRVVLASNPLPLDDAEDTAELRAGLLTLETPSLYRNGQLLARSQTRSAGPAAVIHLPGEASLFLSIGRPLDARFTLAGRQQGTRIDFDYAGNQYRLQTTNTIREGANHVYLYRGNLPEPNPDNPALQSPVITAGRPTPAN